MWKVSLWLTWALAVPGMWPSGSGVLETARKRLGPIGMMKPRSPLRCRLSQETTVKGGRPARRRRSRPSTRKPKTVRPDQLVSETLEILNSTKITALFVVETGRPIGIVHIHDLLRAGAA